MLGPADVEEDLDLGVPRSLPRWAGVLVGALLVAGVATALSGHQGGSSHHPGPAATPSPAAPDDSVRALVGVPGRGELVDVVADRLRLLRPDGSVLRRSAPNTALADATTGVTLCVDAGANTVWVVPAVNNDAGDAEAYTLDTLRPRGRVRIPSPVRDVAAVGGRLYVLQAQAVSVLDQDGRTFDPVALGGYVQSIAADPTRNRLLVAVNAPGALRIRSLRGTAPGPVSAPLDGSPTVVAVANGSIWTDDFQSLVSLAPTTFTTRFAVPVLHAGFGIRLVASGDRSLFVRPVDSQYPLSCLDATTGRLLQYWPDAPGTVAATRGRVLVAPAIGPARALDLRGCTG